MYSRLQQVCTLDVPSALVRKVSLRNFAMEEKHQGRRGAFLPGSQRGTKGNR